VNRGVAVVGHDLLGNQNRILEVVAVPRHEGDQHVLAERELTQIGGRTIGQHVATGDEIATFHDGALVDVGVLVRTRVLGQVVDVDTHFTCHVFCVIHTNHDTLGVDVVHDAAAAGLDGRAGVNGHRALDARA